MPVVSITRVRVRSWLYLPAFLLQTLRIVRQAKQAEGNLAIQLLWDRRNAFWTATSWTSEAAMKAFMHGRPHGPTMRKLLDWCDESALAHWTQPAADPGSWAEAHQRLQKEGRRSKVNHPSPAQTAYDIPAPDARPNRSARLK